MQACESVAAVDDMYASGEAALHHSSVIVPMSQFVFDSCTAIH